MNYIDILNSIDEVREINLWIRGIKMGHDFTIISDRLLVHDDGSTENTALACRCGNKVLFWYKGLLASATVGYTAKLSLMNGKPTINGISNCVGISKKFIFGLIKPYNTYSDNMLLIRSLPDGYVSYVDGNLISFDIGMLKRDYRLGFMSRDLYDRLNNGDIFESHISKDFIVGYKNDGIKIFYVRSCSLLMTYYGMDSTCRLCLNGDKWCLCNRSDDILPYYRVDTGVPYNEVLRSLV